ncbi:DNA packaging protein UL32 [Vespertilionid gammaherpesvirus 1]|uniref:Packaging protein UL32 n=1 Tax=Vespertilionid gammaherpesvirus 1 TaxID=2560830 RepID=A0A0X9XD73_9GAMA|nr:DNA packaging protein UL32 [Myotis gammaherpesvirus 8]AMA67426.1 DNA packaging protein UL32 [Vespertilionid gammaherpesvirus 1]
MCHYLPWRKEVIFKHLQQLQNLLDFSFHPGCPETALNCPVLTNTHKSLLECSHCKICQLVYNLVNKHPPPVQFYEDYSCLCLFALYAPKSWSSTFMIAADFLELLTTYFPSVLQITTLYKPGNILGIDLQLHFFIHKCYRPMSSGNLLDISNLNFLKNEFLRGSLTGSISNLFCFKTIWQSLQHPGSMETTTQPACCSFLRQQVKTAPLPTKTPEALLPSSLQIVFAQPHLKTKSEFLSVFVEIWKHSDLLSHQNKFLAEKYTDLNVSYPETGDMCQGPCLLFQSLQLKKQNNTASVCMLCECVSSHPDAHEALAQLKNDILMSIDNNVKLTDRISFIIHEQSSMAYISDPLLRTIIKGCSSQEIHKHLFCDPLCTVNTAATCTDILFKIPEASSFQKLKSSLAIGTHLQQNHLLDCETLDTLVTIFKSIQTCKVGKTTFLEIIKELNTLLKKHNLHTLHTFHTAHIYC